MGRRIAKLVWIDLKNLYRRGRVVPGSIRCKIQRRLNVTPLARLLRASGEYYSPAC